MTRLTVLCVDDERMVLSSLKEQLRRHLPEIAVETAETGRESLDVFEELHASGTPVPLVVCDQLMPGLRGDEVLTAIHQIEPTTLSVLLTGQASVEAIGAAVNRARLYRYLGKPWAEVDLVMTAREAIRAWEQARLVEQNQAMLRATNESLARFVPDQLLAAIGRSNICDVQLGDHVHREMTVLFCDIRGYTTLAERMTAREAFDFINEHLGGVGPVIREHQGLVAQFYGDGVMAIFPRSPADAVRAAVAMQRRVAAMNDDRKRRGAPVVRIGIGLNSGPLTFGVIGDGQRMDTGVVGDTVNSAARMEGLTKTYDVQIVAAGPVLAGHEGAFKTRFLDRVQVRGRQQMVEIHDVFEGDDPASREAKEQTLEPFALGHAHFAQGRYADALRCFGDVLRVMPTDRPSQMYLERAARLLLEPGAEPAPSAR